MTVLWLIVVVLINISVFGEQVCLDSSKFKAIGEQCSYDGECGNFPYTQCKGGENDSTYGVNGLAEDGTYFYYFEYVRADFGGRKLVLKRVNISGGNPEIIPFISRAYESPYLLYDVVGEWLYYGIYPERANEYDTTIRTYNLKTYKFGPLLSPFAVESPTSQTLDFDKANRKTFAGASVYRPTTGSLSYNIYRFDGIIGQDNVTRIYLYTVGTSCQTIRAQANSDNLYITLITYDDNGVATTRFYRGSKTCVSCSTQPVLLFALVNSTVSDFIVVGSKLFFSSENGTFISDFAGKQITQISSSASANLKFMNNRIVWRGGSYRDIYSANSTGGAPVKRINSDIGVCNCSYGFSGPTCGTCDGQIQWHMGNPQCVTLKNGYPIKCREDYQCNPPYSYCQSIGCQCSCSCGYGKSPSECQQCIMNGNNTKWMYGKPRC